MVFGGVFVHVSAGDTCSPACVYFAGIGSPSAHAGVVSVIAGAGAPPARCPPPCRPPAAGGCPCAATAIETDIVSTTTRTVRIRLSSRNAQYIGEAGGRKRLRREDARAHRGNFTQSSPRTEAAVIRR